MDQNIDTRALEKPWNFPKTCRLCGLGQTCLRLLIFNAIKFAADPALKLCRLNSGALYDLNKYKRVPLKYNNAH
jgi:hypothetical protein